MNARALSAALLLPPLALLSGCATTRLTVRTPDGLVVTVALPKNMDATNLRVSIGDYKLAADKITTDAKSVVDAQGKIVSDVAAAAAAVAIP